MSGVRQVSLYIHVPFCKRRCSYCTFYHLPHVDDYENAFVGALAREIAWAVDDLGGEVRFPTVFLGGGTPSTLSEASFEQVFTAVRPHLKEGAEITVEANPEDVTAERLAHMRSLGVNRLSLGVQSMDDAALRVLKRCTAAVNRRGLGLVSEAFDNFSIDLVLGTPGSSSENLTATLQSVPRVRAAARLDLLPRTGRRHDVGGRRFLRPRRRRAIVGRVLVGL